MASPVTPLMAAPPAPPATISIETGSARAAPGYSVAAFVDAVNEAFTDRGYTILEGHGHARIVAELILTQVEVGTGSAKVPPAEKPTIAAGGVRGVGGNLFVPLSSDKSRIVAILQTRLQVRLRRLGEDTILWDGTALTVRPGNAGNGREKIVASDLARALFRVYPVQPEGVITVP